MARLSGFCCLLLMCSWYQVCKGNPLVVGEIILEGTLTLTGAREKFGVWLDEEKPHDATNSDLLEKMNDLSGDVESMKTEILNKIKAGLQDNVAVTNANEFYDLTSTIQEKYDTFLHYVRNGDILQKSTLHDFANTTTSERDGLAGKLRKMHDLFMDENLIKESFLLAVTKDSIATKIMCEKLQSKQLLINYLFQSLTNSTVKGLLVIAFSYEVKQKYENLSYQSEQQLTEKRTLNKINLVFKKVKEALRLASRTIRRCDPDLHVKDVTYGKLEQVFQGYFAYDGDLFEPETDGPIYFIKDCPLITNARLRCSSKGCKSHHPIKQCFGKIRDCENAPRDFQVCHANPDSERRYGWMAINKNKEMADYGVYNKYGCYKIEEFNTQLIVPNDDNCMCTCESQDRQIDRYFSLQNVLADENKVVTGAKLTLDNHVFHIQIQQGILGPNGTIIDKPEWKNIDAISKKQLLSNNVGRHIFKVQHNNYYDHLHWKNNDLVYPVSYQRRSVYLDTLDTDPSRLVTGLRFRHVGDDLKLEIQTTPFDYATAKLDRAASSWESNSKDIKERYEVILNKPGSPVEVYGNDVVTSNDKYVTFRKSDSEKDLGSWTIPFIDLQEIVTTPPMPLGGAGLIHRGETGSGGFLALELHHYDFSRHL